MHTRSRTGTLLTVAVLIGSLSACRSAVTPAGPHAARVSDSSPEAVARRTVAAEAQLVETAIHIISVSPQQFPDTSLGCPEAGRVYPQVITPGHQVIVEADGRRFDVRVSGAAGRICRNAR